MLVRAHKRLRPVDGRVVVRGAGEQAYMALEMTKLTTMLTVEGSARPS